MLDEKYWNAMLIRENPSIFIIILFSTLYIRGIKFALM